MWHTDLAYSPVASLCKFYCPKISNDLLAKINLMLNHDELRIELKKFLDSILQLKRKSFKFKSKASFDEYEFRRLINEFSAKHIASIRQPCNSNLKNI